MLLNSFREMFPSKTKLTYNFYLSLRPVAVSLLAFVFVFVAGFGTIAVAKNTVPGDILYPVKRIVEKSRMVLVFDQSKKAVLRAEILTNRLSEVKVLTEKVKGGDKESELELNVLAQNFTNELKVLTKQIGDQVIEPQAFIIPFPEEELLYIDEEMTSQGSLPIQDERQVFTVIPTEDLEKLLAETQELLAEENLALAFVRLQEAEKLVQEQEPQPEAGPPLEEVTEPDVVIEDSEEAENQEEETQETLPVQPQPEAGLAPEADKAPLEEVIEPAIEDDLSGSVGRILLKQEKEIDFQVKIEKDSPAQTGMTREQFSTKK